MFIFFFFHFANACIFLMNMLGRISILTSIYYKYKNIHLNYSYNFHKIQNDIFDEDAEPKAMKKIKSIHANVTHSILYNKNI